MRVKMAYSVELEEIPAEARRLLKEAKSWYEELQPLVTRLDRLDTEFASRLETVREKLVAFDARLEDCTALLNGYNEAVINLKKQAEESAKEEGVSSGEEVQEG